MVEARWRIGEMSRRLGVSPQVLRAWERRYGLLAPERSEGGYRLYGVEDERRARALLRYQQEGCSTAEAARLARAAPAADGAAVAVWTEELGRVRERLLATLIRADEAGAQASLDELFAIADLERALADGVLPVLRDIGERWAADDISVAAEHYATNVIQSRLLALARGWDQGAGPQAVLACLPEEQHALGLIAFGLVLRRRGWRVVYLGPNTPLDSVAQWLDEAAPAATVIASVSAERFERAAGPLRALAARARLLLGGAGASPALAGRVGAMACQPDLVASADALTAAVGV